MYLILLAFAIKELTNITEWMGHINMQEIKSNILGVSTQMVPADLTQHS